MTAELVGALVIEDAGLSSACGTAFPASHGLAVTRVPKGTLAAEHARLVPQVTTVGRVVLAPLAHAVVRLLALVSEHAVSGQVLGHCRVTAEQVGACATLRAVLVSVAGLAGGEAITGTDGAVVSVPYEPIATSLTPDGGTVGYGGQVGVLAIIAAAIDTRSADAIGALSAHALGTAAARAAAAATRAARTTAPGARPWLNWSGTKTVLISQEWTGQSYAGTHNQHDQVSHIHFRYPLLCEIGRAHV